MNICDVCSEPRNLWGSLLGTTLLVLFSYHFLDIRLALFVLDTLHPSFVLSKHVSDIPDLLFEMVSAITVLSWVGYFWYRHKGTNQNATRFFQLIGCTLPLSFFLKSLIKHVVGRTNARVWLLNPDLYGLHWFHGGGNYSSFPSGHMAVFTVLGLGLSRFYPRYRLAYLGFLLLLATALIATEYHFLSDVIAGTYLGLFIDLSVHRALSPRQGAWN